MDLESQLLDACAMLQRHADFLTELRATGGTAELFVGYFIAAPNTNIQLSPQLTQQLGALGVSVYIDIYA